MFKKLNILLVVMLLSLTSFNATNALDLEKIDDNIGIEATATGDTATDTNSEASSVKISNMEVIFNDTNLPADWKSETTVFIRVNNNNEDAISEKDIDLSVEIAQNDNNDKWTIKEITYDEDSELFNATYVAGTTAWDVTLKIEAISKVDTTTRLEQAEEIILDEYAPAVEETMVEEPTVEETSEAVNVDNILTSLEEDENIEDANIVQEETKINNNWINIVETKVVDENRLKVTFDRVIFLPDDPLSLVKIEKSEDKSEVKISNITLSDDKLSLVILTSDNIEKVPYLVTITEVIDGETKKKVSVINSELTVTGINELLIVFLGLLSAIWLVAYRRNKNNS